MEREIGQPVLECTPGGRLRTDAIGWSHRPLHRCNLDCQWGRKKRWDYWCVTSDTHLISFTYADCDYLGLASVLFLDEKRMRVNLLLLAAELHLCFGHFEGTVADETGARAPIRRLMGWSEEMRARW